MASINLTWSATVGASSGTFRIKYWPSASPNNIVVIDNVAGISYSISDLDSATTYTGTIESKCINGSYTTPINWTATPAVSGGAGSGLTTAINGQVTASCGSGVSGTITINGASLKKVQISTIYFSGTPSTGSTLSITNATSGAAVASISATPSSLYNAATAVTSVTLAEGTYNYNLSPVPCFTGNGNSTISLVNP